MDSKAQWNRSRKNPTIFISSDSVYDSIDYGPVKTRLSKSEVEAEEQTNHMAWNQALSSIPSLTPTIRFSHHKLQSHKWNRCMLQTPLV